MSVFLCQVVFMHHGPKMINGVIWLAMIVICLVPTQLMSGKSDNEEDSHENGKRSRNTFDKMIHKKGE